MFDHLSLDELKEARTKVTSFILGNIGTTSFSLPDGVSMAVDQVGPKETLREINKSIRRKTSLGGHFVEIGIQ